MNEKRGEQEVRMSGTEIRFLQFLLADHRVYYGTLVQHPRCTESNREKHKEIEGLSKKLECAALLTHQEAAKTNGKADSGAFDELPL